MKSITLLIAFGNVIESIKKWSNKLHYFYLRQKANYIYVIIELIWTQKCVTVFSILSHLVVFYKFIQLVSKFYFFLSYLFLSWIIGNVIFNWKLIVFEPNIIIGNVIGQRFRFGWVRFGSSGSHRSHPNRTAYLTIFIISPKKRVG